VEQRVVDDLDGRPRKFASKWRRRVQRGKRHNAHEDSEDEEKPEEPQAIIGPIPGLDTKHRYFIGKDYSNPYEKDFADLEKYNEDFVDRKSVPRMPWHDEALVVFGQVARDVARHFIQRWNIHKCEKFLYNDSYPFLLPKTYDDPDELRVTNWKDFLDGQPYKVNAQCVRSVGPWSIGTKIIESSIQNAYLQMIDAAEHYIYMENQFFITTANDAIVKNQLAEALFRRVLRAHTSNEKFRIYIILPLLPGFDNVNAVQAVLYFIMRSITKDETSLFKRLAKEGVRPDDYISFYGMRAHDVLMGVLVTEIIYVHSKLMIIDDHMAICGSANINDRSLLGQRDSEVGIVINDTEEIDGVFNGQPTRVGKFCSSWRKRLFSMMLGISSDNPNHIDINDPVSDEFYNYFRDTAKKNTLIFEEVFATLPSNRVRKFDQVSQYTEAPKLKDTDPLEAQKKLKDIQGLIVEYPLYFFDDENYLPSIRTREGLVPSVMWT
jgi:phospholipase D1/2